MHTVDIKSEGKKETVRKTREGNSQTHRLSINTNNLPKPVITA